jgi:ABC-2 type transport system ATP-binding protein
MNTAVSISHLSHNYPARRKSAARQALQDVSLNVIEGSIYGLLGPNGGGKSTLFRILSTALVPSQGEALIFGLDVVKQAAHARPLCGIVFQNPSLDKELTVAENLKHHGHLYGLSGALLNEKIQNVLKRMSLSDRSNDLVKTLSGGLARRVEIAQGLLHNPKLLIMDEPSTGLDPGARRDMWDFLFELKKSGVTILLTTHLMEEGDKCDDLMILHEGRTGAQGSPEALKKKIGGDIIAIQTSDPATVAQTIKTNWKLNPIVLDGTIRVEIQDGHKFVPQLIEAFPGKISSVQLGKPTLEDVFVRETGQTFSSLEKKS